jgi:hypothetical protein
MRSGWGITGSVKESPSGRVLGDMEPTICVCLCWEEEQQCQADKKAQESAQRLFIQILHPFNVIESVFFCRRVAEFSGSPTIQPRCTDATVCDRSRGAMRWRQSK